jgi:hypothetical protein
LLQGELFVLTVCFDPDLFNRGGSELGPPAETPSDGVDVHPHTGETDGLC